MSNTLHTVYQNDTTFLIWKPQNVASSRWASACILDRVKKDSAHPWVDAPEFVSDHALPFLTSWDWVLADRSETIQHLKSVFSHEQEYGLLNRLDTPTWGFLTFAKTPETKAVFLEQQAQWVIHKHYLTLVSGNPEYLINNPESLYPNLSSNKSNPVSIQDATISISTPMKHHRHLDDRMVAIKSDKDYTKGRDSLLQWTTALTLLKQNEKNALIECVITKGQRHQIRVHCATLWYPIVGDWLYGKDKTWELQLWSMGYQL